MNLVIVGCITCTLLPLCLSATLDSKSRHYLPGEDGHLEHNTNFDHESFLGKEEMKEYENLSPEESKKRLSLLVKKIDKDEDGKITEGELTDWVRGVQEAYVWKDVDRVWMEFLGDYDAEWITFEKYKERQYGNNFDENAEENNDDPSINYQKMYRRDLRRWSMADKDGDGKLNKQEFASFLHPDDFKDMSELIALETIEEVDADKDGKISLNEYIADLWPNQDGEEEPEWVKNEKDQFRNFRDHDADGQMDLKETVEWITPSDYDPHLAEARHLMHEADADGDGSLTEQEILDKYEIFVGSQATDFGEYLNNHDEF